MATNTTIVLGEQAGRRFEGYLARPSAERAPCVLVLHDMFGLNEPIRAVADRYA